MPVVQVSPKNVPLFVDSLKKAFKTIVNRTLSPSWFSRQVDTITDVFYVPAESTVLRSRTVERFSAFACVNVVNEKNAELVVIFSERRGLGTELVNAVAAHLPKGCTLVAKDVVDGTEPFYERNGFKVDGTIATRVI
jgi:hypothetical protein